jgi:hypothetical protein
MTAAREAVAAWTRWRRDAGAAGRAKLAGVLGTPCRYGLDPFAMAGNPGRHLLLAMLDPPPATDVEALLAWEPGELAVINAATGRARLAGEPGAWLVGASGGDAVAVFSDGMAWARAWARRRAEALALFRRGRAAGLLFHDLPNQGLPGLLVCGAPGAVADWGALLGRRAARFDDETAKQAAAAWLAARQPVLQLSRRIAA